MALATASYVSLPEIKTRIVMALATATSVNQSETKTATVTVVVTRAVEIVAGRRI